MTLRLAVVGLGGIALKGYLPVITSWEGVEPIFYSRTPEKVERLAHLHRIEKYTTNMDQLMDWKPQAAFILTPTDTHADLARHFMEAGVDVFLEKPATFSSSETQKLAELADARQRILMLAFNRRFAPLNVQARQLWGDRPISMASFEKHRSKPNFTSLFFHMNEELIHIIDLLRFFCGEAHAVNTLQKVDPETNLFLEAVTLLQLENGGFATISASMRAGQWYEHYTLNGGTASLYLDAFSELKLASQGSEQVWKEPYPSTWQSNLVGRGFVGEMEHF
ncbi:MAG: Gfo/Idh/MocA family oxidoreductase, partial [Chloroflexi bacterium]|nr:Gfo/Idh/MocA family oxidoreductase [Chloroflexota bacterium]